jgi:DNA-binding PadR family transcriptional regulator
MHPYQIKKQIVARRKSDRLDLRAGSLYNAIEWLRQKRFVRITGTAREGARPARTTYAITAAGKNAMFAWLGEMLSRPSRAAQPFTVAMDHLVHFSPAEARALLTKYHIALRQRRETIESELAKARPTVPRIHLIEVEHELILADAELRWIDRILAELREKKLSWKPAYRAAHARR